MPARDRSMTIRRSSRAVFGTMLTIMLVAPAMQAHPVIYKGTVLAVEPTRIQVSAIDDTAKKDTPIWFAVNKNTKVKRGDKTIAYADAKITKGERIVITIDHDAKIANLAVEIDLAAK